MSAASVVDTAEAINRACQERGGRYASYRCQVVSWDDASRGTVGGSLSCWGANITDTYLKSKSGERLFTVRSNNWNEKLGKVAADDVMLISGNHICSGSIEPVSLKSFLRSVGKYGAYAGLDSALDLSAEALDAECSIRFQTVFLPVSGLRGTLEFATEAYNYNTTRDDDPRNLILLCTSQGVAVQQDGAGVKRLFHHAVQDDGKIHRHWLEAEASSHRVGGAQQETPEELADALARGKATAVSIGTSAMGTRFNTLMTIQVPLQQQKPKRKFSGDSGDMFQSMFFGPAASQVGGLGAAPKGGEDFYKILDVDKTASSVEIKKAYRKLAVKHHPDRGGNLEDFLKIKKAYECISDPERRCLYDKCGGVGLEGPGLFGGGNSFGGGDSFACFGGGDSDIFGSLGGCGAGFGGALAGRVRTRDRPAPVVGTASASRVSRGTKEDVWSGLSIARPARNSHEHVTVTIVIYNTVADGIPSEDDVVAAIDDLDALYSTCAAEGRLADKTFDFMKADLTAKDMENIG